MKIACAAVALALLQACTARAEPGIDTTLSARADAWSGDRLLDDARGIARASLWDRAKIDGGAAGRGLLDGWLATQSRNARSGQRAQLREAWWRFDAGPLDVTLGRQLISWGRADGLNPTDNFSPRDYTLLVPEDTEQRRGNDGLRLAGDVGIGQLSAFWAPRAASHTLPLQALPGVRYQVEAPPWRRQFALKLELAGEGIDGSLSWFDGDDAMPDIGLAGMDAMGATLAVRNHPLRTLGADLALTRDGVVWRAEAAWSRSGSSGGSGTADFERKRDRLWLVAGGEWSLPGSTTLGLQLTAQQLRGWVSPDAIEQPLLRQVAWRQAALSNQTAARQLGFTWRLATRLRNDTLLLETSGVVLAHPRSSLWRTKLSFAIDDHWQALAGTEVFSGPESSLWGQLKRNRLTWVQLRHGW